MLLYRNVYNGMDSFPLMAIPFFMLAGELMNRGGITMRLVEFSQALIGHLRGGLAHVNVLSSMLFAGLSGSAVADVSALGSMLIPAMEKQGYTRRFAAAITAAILGDRPDHPALGDHDHLRLCHGRKRGGAVPGRHRAGHPGRPRPDADDQVSGRALRFAGRRTTRATWRERGQASLKAFWPLLTPVIILGGILGGVFTPTEAAAVAVGYAIVIGAVRHAHPEAVATCPTC